jgi:predicted metal-dependent peptidase
MQSMNTLSALTAEQELHLQAWRATALEKMPYMAALLFSLRPVNHPGVDTFAVDNRHRLYINFKNAAPKGPAFCAEALMHEASHLLADHNLLADSTGVLIEERRLWNYAGDCAINDDLRDAGCDLLAGHGVFAKNIGMDDYLTPMEYMARLRELRDKAEAKKKSQQGQSGQDSDDEGQGSGSGQQDDDSTDQQDQDGGDSGEGDQDSDSGQGGNSGQDQEDLPLFKGCGSGSGGEAAPGELGDDDLGGEAPGIEEVDKEIVRIATVAAIEQHQATHGIGSVPGGIASQAEQIMKPTQTPWEKVAAAYIRRCVAFKAGHADTSFSRRNRRRMNDVLRTDTGQTRGRLIVPGWVKPVPSIHFYRDTSGSMGSARLEKVSREVVTIAKKLGITGEELVISDVDTRVYDARKFTNAKMLNTITGHGGTDMGEAIVHACSLRKKPSVIVIATDGETGWPQSKPSIPVVVLLVNASKYYVDQVPSWAKVVEVGVE